MIKLSIITINRNNAEGLNKTIHSVLSQNYSDFEYIVVDGASTDDSVDVIKNYEQKSLPIREGNRNSLLWISEPDTGIYNAMNKGIRLATGEYVLFLNSGDILVNENVITQFMLLDTFADIVACRECFSNGKVYIPPKQEYLSYDYLVDQPLMHQSTFIKKTAFDKYGLYNENHRIVSDWEWWIKALVIGNATYETQDIEVALFDRTGVSNEGGKWRQIHDAEIANVRAHLLPRVDNMSVELRQLRQIVKEYDFLKNGKFGAIVRFFLYLKKMK